MMRLISNLCQYLGRPASGKNWKLPADKIECRRITSVTCEAGLTFCAVMLRRTFKMISLDLFCFYRHCQPKGLFIYLISHWTQVSYTVLVLIICNTLCQNWNSCSWTTLDQQALKELQFKDFYSEAVFDTHHLGHTHSLHLISENSAV